MYPHVFSQAAGLRERLAERVADMRLLIRMCPRVPSQVMCQRERLASCLADMRLLPRMRAHGDAAHGRRERRHHRLTAAARYWVTRWI